jgi:hypothetical protein
MEPTMTEVPPAQAEARLETDAPARPGAQRAATVGALLASARVDAAGLLGDIWLGGDVIAPAATMRSLAEGLRGKPPERDTLTTSVASVLARPDDFLLGASAEDVAAVVVAAAGR